MIGWIKSWLLGVTCAAMILALAENLAPEGGVKRVCRLAGGLVLLLAAISPMVKLDPAELADIVRDYQSTAETYSQALEEENQFLYESIIEKKTAAYILDKAAQLGIECTVSVTVAWDEAGMPHPDTAALSGNWTGAQRKELSAILDSELGIPAQRQYFEEKKP